MENIVILNVDDNSGARHAKTRLLLNAGFRVEEAADGVTALSLVDELVPALVVLDVKLPDMSGHEVCRRIKAGAATSGVLVLQTSAALLSSLDTERGMDSGADYYLAAPFEPKDLVNTVRALLHAQR